MKLTGVIATVLAAGLAVSAQAKDIEMQSIFPGTLPLIGAGAVALGEKVSTLTDGTLNINFNNPGALVGASGLWDAVSTGAVDAGWMPPDFAEGVIPSAALFTAFPFGPDAREYGNPDRNSAGHHVPRAGTGLIFELARPDCVVWHYVDLQRAGCGPGRDAYGASVATAEPDLRKYR
jgi:TRAP-type mannitol/chloroaromatic compound transport system substrate-binding protein